MAYRETPEVVDGVIRLIGAIGKRVAEEESASLREIEKLQTALDNARRVAVDGLRASGESDTMIGRALGVTKQAVAERFPRRR